MGEVHFSILLEIKIIGEFCGISNSIRDARVNKSDGVIEPLMIVRFASLVRNNIVSRRVKSRMRQVTLGNILSALCH